MTKTVFVGPTLVSQTRTGKAKYWYGQIILDGDEYKIQKVWWQEGSEKLSSTPYTVESKNVGKANETLPLDQAHFELNSIYQKQRDKGYSEDGTRDHVPTKPMLAMNYEDRKHNIVFPCFVQPKLDGFRMLMDGKRAWTRGGKEHVAQCVAHLMFDTGGITLDGELLLPGNRPLQETSQAAKKYRPDVSPTLEYWVYDMISDLDFYIRSDMVLACLDAPGCPANVRVVPTFEVRNEEELFRAHVEFVAQGYEGTMVRNRKGPYESSRSPNLQKMKDFQDGEFLVVDIIDGKGSFEGHAIVVCETSEGKRFNVTPEGTMEMRASIYASRGSYIGQYLTVRYQTLSKDGIPIFPIGVDFRQAGEF